MNAPEIIEQFKALGVSVFLVGDLVRVTPRSRAPAELVEALKERKPEVVALLQHGVDPAVNPATDRGPAATAEATAVAASPFARKLHQQLLAWAGDDTARWRRLHAALLAIYAPEWHRTDGRDLLVMWLAARLGASQARRELVRFQGMRQPLTGREADARAARQADLSFWQRVAARYQDEMPAVLTADEAAARVIRQIVQRKV